MQEIISQLKFDIQSIESLNKAIKKAKLEMDKLKGKPAYETRKEAINLWETKRIEHKITFDEYYIKFKELKF